MRLLGKFTFLNFDEFFSLPSLARPPMAKKSTLAASANIVLRKKALKNGQFHLYIDTHQNGKRVKEYLHLYITGNKDTDNQTLELAKKIHAKRVLEIQAEAHGEIDRSKMSADFMQFFAMCVEEKKRAKRWTNTHYHLKAFTQGKPIAFRNVVSSWVESFQDYLRDKVAHNTLVHYMETIKAALNIAVKRKIIATNPCIYATLETTKESRREYLTFEELQMLHATDCDAPEVKRAFLFACFTGLRVSDVRALTWGQIKGDRMFFKQQKTSTQEYMPLSASALAFLGAVPRGKTDEPIFGLLSEQHLHKHLKRWFARAGMTKSLSFHSSRHTFATLALNNGVDIMTVSKLLGHTELRNTLIYAKIIDKTKDDAVKKLPTL